MSATKAEKLHQIAARGGQVTSLDGANDLLYLSRQTSPGQWDNKVIDAADLTADILSSVNSSAYTLPGEIENGDGWACEFFEQYAVGANPTLDKGVGWDGNGAGSGLSIVSRNIYTGKAENRLVIANGQYGRKLLYGDAWNRIQIGILFRVNGLVTFTGDGCIGLCSGVTNMAASAACDNFVGIRFDSATLNSWAFSAGTRVNKYFQSTGTRFITRRAASDTDRGSGSGSDGRTFSASEGYRSMLFLEIARPVFATDATSVLYSMGMLSTDATQVEMSLSKRSFVAALMDVVATNLGVGTTTTLVCGASVVRPTAFSFDQSTGKLDALNITWPNANQTIELTAVAVRKVY